jgi:bifunctional DNase/RNase
MPLLCPALLLLAALAIQGCNPASTRAEKTLSMQVEGVSIDVRTSSHVLLLQEESGARRKLPIWIGGHEARSIALEMEDVRVPRPNTHDLVKNVLNGLGAKLDRVVVTELRGGTYYAEIELDLHGRSISIDSRPSDAIAVALRTGAPVFATDRVLRQAGRLAAEGALDVRWSPGGRRAESTLAAQ